jgi:hypothetical protein
MTQQLSELFDAAMSFAVLERLATNHPTWLKSRKFRAFQLAAIERLAEAAVNAFTGPIPHTE